MVIEKQDLERMTNEIWGGMLQMEVHCSAVTRKPQRGIGACVLITGAWEGAVSVDCSFELATKAAARFLAIEPDFVQVDQVRDAMGELANMSAGSVKPLLPKPSQLSLPSVADGTDYTFSVPQGEVWLESRFELDGEPLRVTVIKRKGLS
jgi:chemotaxis protein CheX